MIASATLLSAVTPPARGPARPPGGAAFVLPDDAGEPDAEALLPGDGERHDDAVPGNVLPDAPVDPWLLTLVTPANVAVPPPATVSTEAADVVAVSGTAIATPLPLPVPASSPAPAPAPVDASARPIAMPMTSVPPAVGATAAPDLVSPRDKRPTPPVPAQSSRTSFSADAVPPLAQADASAIASPLPKAEPLDSPPRPPASDGIDTFAIASNAMSVGVVVSAEPSFAGEAVVAPSVLPAAALATSALTPLRRQEIAPVAVSVDEATPLVTGRNPMPLPPGGDAAIVGESAPARLIDLPSQALLSIIDRAPPRPLPANLAAMTAAAPAATPSPINPPRADITPSLPLGWTLTTPSIDAPSTTTATLATPPVTIAATSAVAVLPTAEPSIPPAEPIVLADPRPVSTPTAPPVAVAQVQTSPAPLPTAAVAFGAARFAVQQGERRDDPLAPAGPTSATATAALAPAPIAAPAVSGPIDVRHERWPTAMIERIEIIRTAVAEAADAADTRIRLIPDALGAIDVDVRRDGDTLHVRFTADQPQTRALLHDAQPRLAEAAEQRGLKLGQTSIGADAGGQAQQHAQQHGQPRQATVAVPPRALRSTVAAAESDADGTRLA
jgi:hypothetical protein